MNARRQVVIAAAAAIGVTALFFFILLKPKMDQISKTKDDVQAARGQVATLQTEIAHLQDVKRNAPQTMAKLAALSQYLPSTPDLPGFIRLVQDAATSSGLDLQSIAPSPPAALPGSTGVQVISVTLTAQGGYFRIEDFLARLEQLERAVAVRSLALAPSQSAISSLVSLNTTITLNMFVAQPGASARGGTTTPAALSPSPSAASTP
jgi:type IV pilus assembly protein PilO